MSDLPDWFNKPVESNNLFRTDRFRRDFYVCTNCGGQSCGGIYSSVCPQCNGIQSDPPRGTRSDYLCNNCAYSPKRFICKCDYPVVPRYVSPPTQQQSRSPYQRSPAEQTKLPQSGCCCCSCM